jgi:tyrosyl-tRNA synthetase
LWLSAERTSPYHFYQYWINLDDAEVGRCLRFFTDLGQAEIDSLLAEHQSDPGQRGAQRRLAAALTRLVHGDEGLRTAQHATDIFFGAEIDHLSDAQLAGIFAHVPSKQLPRERLDAPGLPITDALIASGLCKNKSEARRLITQGGAYVNNRRMDGIESQLTGADLASESMIVLRTGKKNYALLKFQ